MASASGERLLADLTFRNQAEKRATFTDRFRTSAFAIGGTNDQLIVADEGCGYAVPDPGDPIELFLCQAYLDILILDPGQRGTREIAALADRPGMTPLSAGHYKFKRRVKFDFTGHSRPAAKEDLIVSFDVAAAGAH